MRSRATLLALRAAILVALVAAALAAGPAAGRLGHLHPVPGAPAPSRAPRCRCRWPATGRSRARSRSASSAAWRARRPSASAVVALAGGPGQAALPLAEFIAEGDRAGAARPRPARLRPARHRQLRAARLPARVERFSGGSIANAVRTAARCRSGRRGGASRPRKASRDIEALRVAGGLLRSSSCTAPPTAPRSRSSTPSATPNTSKRWCSTRSCRSSGPEPFAIPSFRALPGVAAGALRQHAPARESRGNPVADLAALNARLRRHALGGSVYDGSGRRHAATLDEAGLLRTIEAGDVNPALRALLPAAVRSALRGDPDPLLRLHVLSEGLIPTLPRERAGRMPRTQVDEALFATTTCEETPVPVVAQRRRRDPAGRSPRLPRRPSRAATSSLRPGHGLCREPARKPARPGPTPRRRRRPKRRCPNVPTLILSGAQDLRTPTSNARAVAAGSPTPSSRSCPSPGTRCSAATSANAPPHAVASFFGGHAPCRLRRRSHDLLRADPGDPTPARARSRAPHGLSGRPGRTLVAVLDAIVDLNRQVIGATLQADAELPERRELRRAARRLRAADRLGGRAARLLVRARRGRCPAGWRSVRGGLGGDRRSAGQRRAGLRAGAVRLGRQPQARQRDAGRAAASVLAVAQA